MFSRLHSVFLRSVALRSIAHSKMAFFLLSNPSTRAHLIKRIPDLAKFQLNPEKINLTRHHKRRPSSRHFSLKAICARICCQFQAVYRGCKYSPSLFIFGTWLSCHTRWKAFQISSLSKLATIQKDSVKVRVRPQLVAVARFQHKISLQSPAAAAGQLRHSRLTVECPESGSLQQVQLSDMSSNPGRGIRWEVIDIV